MDEVRRLSCQIPRSWQRAAGRDYTEPHPKEEADVASRTAEPEDMVTSEEETNQPDECAASDLNEDTSKRADSSVCPGDELVQVNLPESQPETQQQTETSEEAHDDELVEHVVEESDEDTSKRADDSVCPGDELVEVILSESQPEIQQQAETSEEAHDDEAGEHVVEELDEKVCPSVASVPELNTQQHLPRTEHKASPEDAETLPSNTSSIARSENMQERPLHSQYPGVRRQLHFGASDGFDLGEYLPRVGTSSAPRPEDCAELARSQTLEALTKAHMSARERLCVFRSPQSASKTARQDADKAS